VKYASHYGFEVRFSTQLISVERLSDSNLCTVKDGVTNITYQIRAKYVFGADGGRSTVARLLDFKFHTEPSMGVACNILLNADLSNDMHERHAQLHWIMKPDMKSRFGIAPTLRMVRPWKQWLLVAFTPGTSEDPFKDLITQSPELIGFLKEIIGDETVDVEVLRIDPWVIRESAAEKMSNDGNVFLLGDAAHRHPPAYGLGSNTCIQDAYNLAWKIAYVSKGLAGPALLETYNVSGSQWELILLGKRMKRWYAIRMFGTLLECSLRRVKKG
jgi:2-polyprenyl-6-methoxyphenol hydroxylase-like FAD-dependent oxidoreductase